MKVSAKLLRGEINGLQFFYRDGFSDLKTFEEVVGRKTYLKKGMTIEKGERWMDAGGNVGAFALLAISKGAIVTIYEPCPNNCKMIEKNLALNGFDATIKNAALISGEPSKMPLHLGSNNAVWRNSLVKQWNGGGTIMVDAVNFDEQVLAGKYDCCKMDIEGAEMPILETTKSVFSKLVYEWSFDIDPSLERFWGIVERQNLAYNIANLGNSAAIKTRDVNVWQNNWIPKCLNVFCFKK